MNAGAERTGRDVERTQEREHEQRRDEQGQRENKSSASVYNEMGGRVSDRIEG